MYSFCINLISIFENRIFIINSNIVILFTQMCNDVKILIDVAVFDQNFNVFEKLCGQSWRN